MLKKIKVEDLRVGMYVVDVTLSWSKLLSLERKFYVKDNKIPLLLKDSGFKEIFIETVKTKKPSEFVATTVKETDEVEVVDEFQKELEKAESIRLEAYNVISSIMTDVRNGKKIVIREINNIVKKVVDSILLNQHALVGLAKMQQKNRYIFEHAVSSCTLMVAFANSLNFNVDKQLELGVGAMLHDIGMMNVPTKTLNKPGKLTKQEIINLRKHVEYGVNILKNTPGISDDSILMAEQHHERFDGSGYPKGLKGEEISLVGQMVAIVDVYDASTTDKGYNKGVTPSSALVDILAKSKKEFDNNLVEQFIQTLGIYPFGTLLRLKNGLVGIVINLKSSNLLYPTIRVIYNPQKSGMVKPFDLNLEEFQHDEGFKIRCVESKEKLFLKSEDLTKLIGLKSQPVEQN